MELYKTYIKPKSRGYLDMAKRILNVIFINGTHIGRGWLKAGVGSCADSVQAASGVGLEVQVRPEFLCEINIPGLFLYGVLAVFGPLASIG